MTLKRIAERARVSRSTVSLVLHDSPLVAERTRARVRCAMAEIGYVYDRGAARLRTGVSHTVGIVVSEITNPFYAELTAGLEAGLERRGWIAFLANSGDAPERQERFIRRIREQGADGIVLSPAEGTAPDLLQRLHAQRMPVVQVLREIAGCEGDFVAPDFRQGMVLAAEHLIGAGHRRIAFIRSHRQTSAVAERLAGLHATLARHGLPPGPVTPCPSERARAAEVVAGMLAAPSPPTAVICHNDVIALGVLSGLARLGIRPGAGLAVVGFDDIAESGTAIPALTTVATGPAAVGEAAAALLLRRIADPEGAPERIVLPCRLVVRET